VEKGVDFNPQEHFTQLVQFE